jgi:hypothetical protein
MKAAHHRSRSWQLPRYARRLAASQVPPPAARRRRLQCARPHRRRNAGVTLFLHARLLRLMLVSDTTTLLPPHLQLSTSRLAAHPSASQPSGRVTTTFSSSCLTLRAGSGWRRCLATPQTGTAPWYSCVEPNRSPMQQVRGHRQPHRICWRRRGSVRRPRQRRRVFAAVLQHLGNLQRHVGRGYRRLCRSPGGCCALAEFDV